MHEYVGAWWALNNPSVAYTFVRNVKTAPYAPEGSFNLEDLVKELPAAQVTGL